MKGSIFDPRQHPDACHHPCGVRLSACKQRCLGHQPYRAHINHCFFGPLRSSISCLLHARLDISPLKHARYARPGDLATRREGPAAAAAAAQHSQSPSCNFMRAAASALIPFSFRMPSPWPNANNNQRGGAHSASDKRLDRCEANNYSYRVSHDNGNFHGARETLFAKDR